jgi:LmbE family N-acetylglucosaminyl deacetylase
VYLPAYQRGHPDHDATYLAGALARDELRAGSGLVWWVYGLYGFDRTRRSRFGWLPPDIYSDIQVQGRDASLLEAKGRALSRFTSQVWPGSALDLWLRAPADEQVAPMPARWERLPDWPCFYDEQLGFGRHGASGVEVEAAFQGVLAAHTR